MNCDIDHKMHEQSLIISLIQLSCHTGAAVCQDTGVLGGQGYRGLAGQGYRDASLGRATGG